MMEGQGFVVGKDVFVAYSPERIDPGNQTFTLENTPKIVGGVTAACTEVAALAVGKNAYPVSSTKIAEMAKVFENTFRFINIGLVNETAMLCEKMGIDTWEMIKASGTKPYGFMAFQPGPGIGGHCIPVDPFYLTWKAEQMGEKTKMIELAGQINDGMSRYVVDQSMKLLNKKKKALNGSKVAVLGVAYKKDINDLRESPVLPIIKELVDEGANVLLCDPHVPHVKIGKTMLPIHQDEKEKVKEADLVLVTTNHSAFDYEYIAEHASIIFDTRNGFEDVKNIKADYYKL
jgi:UDP-N-acetyl-D-glucosamine dehydrogenase